jgi:tRNA(Ile)-lysidine synthase TilS/MesJ
MPVTVSSVPINPIDAVDVKVDVYLRRHVIPVLAPENIHWWFSLSGGKDSFSMAHSVRRWYQRAGLKFSASTFVIDQWGGAAARSIGRQSDWQTPTVIDGRAVTLSTTGYQAGQQAPCRSCSDVRHDLTDLLLQQNPPQAAHVPVVARGLHLSDTAVSLLWRHALGRDPSAEMIRLGKAQPLARLPRGAFLAKPLSYVREFESAAYANHFGFEAACCGCPACRFPSRRDIVEETLRDFFAGPLWEFEIPGMGEFLQHFGTTDVKSKSAAGVFPKHRHLPDGFARLWWRDFAK